MAGGAVGKREGDEDFGNEWKRMERTAELEGGIGDGTGFKTLKGVTVEMGCEEEVKVFG